MTHSSSRITSHMSALQRRPADSVVARNAPIRTRQRSELIREIASMEWRQRFRLCARARLCAAHVRRSAAVDHRRHMLGAVPKEYIGAPLTFQRRVPHAATDPHRAYDSMIAHDIVEPYSDGGLLNG